MPEKDIEMEDDSESIRLTVQFISEEGSKCGAPLDVPINISLENIRKICSQYLEQVRSKDS